MFVTGNETELHVCATVFEDGWVLRLGCATKRTKGPGQSQSFFLLFQVNVSVLSVGPLPESFDVNRQFQSKHKAEPRTQQGEKEKL